MREKDGARQEKGDNMEAALITSSVIAVFFLGFVLGFIIGKIAQ